MPKRIQRRRSKGWRLPAGAVCVTRPGKWGNLHKPNGSRLGRQLAWLHFLHDVRVKGKPSEADIRRELRGKDLACWCPVGADFCHADVLLRIANS